MSVKLYRNNESGEVVSAGYVVDMSIKGKFSYYVIFNGQFIIERLSFEKFNQAYTALPEAPEDGEWIYIKNIPNAYSIGSDEWAIAMLKRGEKVQVSTWNKDLYLWMDDHGTIFNEHGNFVSFEGRKDNWEIYSPPKPIVELLPHEFVPGQEVLVRDNVSYKWAKKEFISYAKNLNTHRFRIRSGSDNIGFRYCIPYAENAHLEGKITDTEHGAVPKGYVPPRVQKKNKLKICKPCLVRDGNKSKWVLDIFIEDRGDLYRCADGYFKHCIQYKGNKHLLGTTDAEGIEE